MSKQHNTMPTPFVEMKTFEEKQDFFFYQKRMDSRQPFKVPGDYTSGTFNLTIFWVDEEKGLGFGVACDHDRQDMVWYRFGSDESWDQHIKMMCEANY